MAPKAQFTDETSDEGAFVRQEDGFRDWVSADPATAYPLEPGRYHLYISLACPWASRALIVRNLKGLENSVGISIADPIRDERGWAFREGPGHGVDVAEHFEYLREAYRLTDPHFHGRVIAKPGAL
jgi:glutathionyl-hydroquinone reductase